jgi:TPP-dependent pyruvate/acetoin dehydrogenase alpha subunit
VDEAVAIAENDPFPDPAETLDGVFADQNAEAPLAFANTFFFQVR